MSTKPLSLAQTEQNKQEASSGNGGATLDQKPLAFSHSELFFELYSQVPALVTTLKRANQAIQLFEVSERQLLEKLIGPSDKTIPIVSDVEDSYSENYLSAVHSLLALIYWLYPNHPGYERLKNARTMFRHATEAVSVSRSKISASSVAGLLIQLRVLPFLIRSKKATVEQLVKTRQLAEVVIGGLSSSKPSYVPSDQPSGEIGNRRTIDSKSNLEPYQVEAFQGLLTDGLGFSYWQLERDNRVALDYLTK